MVFILGRKIGMSQIFDEKGEVVPVTLIEAGPCSVVQVKTKEKDGYEAVQIGLGTKKQKRTSRAEQGHFKKAGLKGAFRYLREFKNGPFLKAGEIINLSVFKPGDMVKIIGISKSKGFQGVVKRHGFRGAPASHGTKHALRAPGSIGGGFPERVLKGQKMAGRMGGDRVTVRGLRIVEVDKENNLLAVMGAVPGRKGALLEIVKIKEAVHDKINKDRKEE